MLTQRIPLSSLSTSKGYLTVSINLDFNEIVNQEETPEDGELLSVAEMRVVKHINLPAKNIASKLNLSQATIKKHIGNMLKKTGCGSSRELAVWADRQHMLN